MRISVSRSWFSKQTHTFHIQYDFPNQFARTQEINDTLYGLRAESEQWEREREREFLIFNWLKFSKVNKWFFIICRNEVVKFHSPLPQRRNYLHIMEASDFNCIKQTSTMPLWVWWRFSSLEFFSAPRSHHHDFKRIFLWFIRLLFYCCWFFFLLSLPLEIVQIET